MKITLSVLGTAQDAGVPHINCFCKNCSQAIRNPLYRRLAASLALVCPEKNRWHLIDCTPDFREQMRHIQERYHLNGKPMDHIFLTHAHMGHFPGILYLGKEAMNTQQQPVLVGNDMKSMLERNAPWKKLITDDNISLTSLAHHRPFAIQENVRIQPFNVPHRNEFSETFGFWINGPQKKVLYIPDIDDWNEWETDIYNACQAADICILDGTFHSKADLSDISRNYEQIPHPFMTDTMDRLQELVSNGKTDVYFTHLNHSNPVLDEHSDERNTLIKRGFKIAQEGMEWDL